MQRVLFLVSLKVGHNSVQAPGCLSPLQLNVGRDVALPLLPVYRGSRLTSHCSLSNSPASGANLSLTDRPN